ncbi:MAG: phospho-sugar mutase [Balneola sp.]|nr:phospho-sugar mutase [Balneola sp.]MBO6651277.1 phospho-sugar mutase [Balneola sp.]MBO6710858.1 phospho-sugar mutase [Balneola sp.]MBO6799545.1 phospho-sugar mutase [Balneola sp.]MBO6870277.1 phospho-sugar mutase [Balneola sp.]
MKNLDSSVQQKIDQWLEGSYDENAKQEIRSLIDQEKFEELTDAFYKDLEFGTGGLRGIMGVGSNRVNKYTFGVATQGFSNFLKKTYPDQQIKVAIAHDCRNNSDTLAKVVADVFSANGIKVYFFEGLRPTPELSYAVRELNCQGGVVLTASHNPKEYNGFKAYGADGGQLVSPHDKAVMDEVQKVASVDEVKFEGNNDLIELIGEGIDQKYLAELKKLSVSEKEIQNQKDLKIVFSPIHGTAGVLVPPALKMYGFENVTLVEEQMVVDGNFPTVVYPNPEEQDALAMALDKAKEIDAELVMATDPDADRIGIAVKDTSGEWTLLNGNQTACLIINYMLTAWKNAGKLNGNQYIVKTVVTSYLIDEIAESYSVDCFNTLTGFKYIGELMTNFEGEKEFIAGGEESYGYLIGEHVRDKDAVVSAVIIAEMAAYYKDNGSSLYEALLEMYVDFGIYQEKLISITKKGKSGAEEILEMMKNFRETPPVSLGGSDVVTIKDYKSAKEKNVKTGEVSQIDLPSSNVLQFITEDGAIISARPSGTEPKIKFYCSVNDTIATVHEYPFVQKKLMNKIDQIMEELAG